MDAQGFVSPYASGRRDSEMAYCRNGVSQFIKSSGGSYSDICLVRCPGLLRVLRRMRDSYSVGKSLGRLKPVYERTIDRLARVIGGKPRQGPEMVGDMTAKLVFQLPDGTEVKAFIDLLDAGDLDSPHALAACDLYFKTSYGKDRSYPAKVVPFYQCSFLLTDGMERIRAMRATPKSYDLCFTTRVWGGSNDTEGIEHNLRILEALSKVKCTKYLRAYLIAGDKASYARRLDKQGIPWSFDPLPWSEHWNVLASSRLNIHRLGMHRSMTWRMSELLCMGACPRTRPASGYALARTFAGARALPQLECRTACGTLGCKGRAVRSDSRACHAVLVESRPLSNESQPATRLTSTSTLAPCELGRQMCAQVLKLQTMTLCAASSLLERNAS